MRLKSKIGLLVLLLIVALFAGCQDEEQIIVDGGIYPMPTAPESVLTNLQISYRTREIEHYVEVLAPEFKFKFQPLDVNYGQFWTRDQDSTGTRALLTTSYVSQIRINLTYGNRDSSVDTSPPVDSLKIRIINTDLEVDQTDGITWVVTDPQDFFLRLGQVERGENPSYWFIYEWDDLAGLESPRVSGPGHTTWGKLKTMYPNQ